MDACDILLRAKTNAIRAMSLPAHPRSTPRLHPLQTHTAVVGLESIMKPSPKRKRTGSQSDITKNFEPDISLGQELEKAQEYREVNSHFKGIRFSPKVAVTPKTLEDWGMRGQVGEGEEGASSPRTDVAKRLGEMELHKPAGEIPVLKFGGEGEKERKKARLEGFEDVSSATRGEDGFGSRRAGGSGLWHHSLSFRERETQNVEVMEVPETPQPPAPASHEGSPPPPTSTSTSNVFILPSTTYKPPKSPDAPNAADLTWQDSEITGHLALDPDDDGYGVNGIGFRPTPAMAYARSQRRRQQISEWKNRESREARSRRAEERRRGIKLGRGGAAGEKGRSVRFVE
jgi:hypothetical protein